MQKQQEGKTAALKEWKVNTCPLRMISGKPGKVLRSFIPVVEKRTHA